MKNIAMVFAACLLPFVVHAGPVNINTADAEELSRELNGIGLSKAQAIVDELKASNHPAAIVGEVTDQHTKLELVF